MPVSTEVVICFGRIYKNPPVFKDLFYGFPIVDFIDVREFPTPSLYDSLLDFEYDDELVDELGKHGAY